MNNPTISDDYTIIVVTVTTTPTVLRKLIADASKTIPTGTILQIALTPADNISVQDTRQGQTMTLNANESKVFPIAKGIDILTLSISALTTTCAVEIYIGK